MMTLVYDLAYSLALLVGWPLLVYRRMTRGPGSLALGERLGNIPSRPVSAHCVWIHGVSLGEINATRTIVAELHRRSPDTVVVVSSTTHTGLDRARELYPRNVVFRFPLDFSFTLRRAFHRMRPSVIVLMELEVWPNLMEVARRLSVPVLIANGRVTDDRTMRHFRRPLLRSVARRMFAKVSWVAAQNEAYAQRFVELGVPPERLSVVGSVKYDTAEISDHIEGQEQLASAMTISRHAPMWCCGSSGPGEESIILDAHAELLASHPTLQLAIVPRKPERFDEVAALIQARGFTCLRRGGKPPLVPRDVLDPKPVFLIDTLGELRKVYALSDLIVVGRSLVPMGGSDVMEAAALGKPVIVGPHMDNFADATAILAAADALEQVTNAGELARAVRRLLESTSLRETRGIAARQAIASKRGATHRIVTEILSRAAIV